MDWLESGEHLVPGNHRATVSNIMNYRKSSIKPPSQISPLPLTSPPFQGKKVINPPSPPLSPNYSSLINDIL